MAQFIRVYKSGRVERYFGSDPVPASTDAATGVASKDRAISPIVAVRLYLPPATEDDGGSRRKLPILVYFHGGGFCLHTAFNFVFHAYLTSLAARTRAIVVSVEYRLAPEHPLPAAYDDSWRALCWVASHAAGAGSGGEEEEPWLADRGDFSRLSVGGESAGANIAHHMAMRAGAEPLPRGARISSAVVVHPYFLGAGRVASEETDPAMARSVVAMWRVVCPGTTGVDEPRINPLAAGAPGLRRLACSCASRRRTCSATAAARTPRGSVPTGGPGRWRCWRWPGRATASTSSTWRAPTPSRRTTPLPDLLTCKSSWPRG
ncbi:hypothetical protein PVAP13_2KG354100 [Panicum virgatum]|uniref:Alpha/beta hydrolase fold-3 domain-containing protein n=1 Tax=Panicum virgatum TaxID=38727 RepID=A0A8T0W3P0_PANVG|nr:hypothetical protein PVAP13_2KG354100 [Panicum virgatum]